MKIRSEFYIATLLLVMGENSEARAPRRKGSRPNRADVNDPGEPLFLSPLIEAGRIEDAQKMAKVEHPQLLNVKSYAGYFTVNERYNSNMFFWYFPAEVDSANAPVLLYLEGGPGASGLFGIFVHNGPFVINENYTITRREETWSKSHNLLYVDNPVGTGWSFTENEAGYARNETQVGQEILKTLVQFFKLFPDLRNNDFYVSGESYAGKFVPAACHAIHLYNPTTRSDKINLKGMAIGNGFTDPINQLVYGQFLYQVGLIDENGREEFEILEKQVRDLIVQEKHDEAADAAGKLVDGEATLFKNLTGYNWIFNILRTEDPIRVDRAYLWSQRVDVRRSLHVGNRTFNMWGLNVATYMKNDITRSEAGHVAELLEHYRVLVYTGQLDIVVGYTTVKNYLNKLCWSGAQDYRVAARKQWRIDGALAGFVKTARTLTDVLVRNAGHVAAMDQPAWVLNLIEKFTRGRDIAANLP